MNKKCKKIFCDTCGRITQHRFCGTAKREEYILDETEGQEIQIPIVWEYNFLQCDACQDVSIYINPDFAPDDLQRFFPTVKNFSGVPEFICKSYDEAKKVKNVSSTAFVILIRRAMEFLCQDHCAVGKNLQQRLKDLHARGILPETLANMTDVIRDIGNIGAHDSKQEISFVEVGIIDDFFLATLEYVYIAPEKLKRIRSGK